MSFILRVAPVVAYFFAFSYPLQSITKLSCVSEPELDEVPVSGSQFFERKVNFQGRASGGVAAGSECGYPCIGQFSVVQA